MRKFLNILFIGICCSCLVACTNTKEYGPDYSKAKDYPALAHKPKMMAESMRYAIPEIKKIPGRPERINDPIPPDYEVKP